VHVILIVCNVSIILLFILTSLGTNGPTGAGVPLNSKQTKQTKLSHDGSKGVVWHKDV
jgi:hypothetical protein